MGECLIDFTPQPNGSYIPNVGGAPYNVAACVAKFGINSSFVGKAGKDDFGKMLITAADSFGVNTKHLITDSDKITSHAFVTLDGSGDRDFVFCRSADIALSPDEITEELTACDVFHFGSLSLTDEPARAATYKALNAAKAKGAIISFDPNYRAPLWKNESEFVKECKAVLDIVDVLKLSEEEARLLAPSETALKSFEMLAESKLAFMTCGENGAYYALNGEIGHVPTVRANTVDTTGAGDVFFSTVIAQIIKNDAPLNNLDLEAVKHFTEKACHYATKSTECYGAVPKFAFNA